jgi:omega-hydroxy-beta-dihydromenaquinone-9 sulfotransferase
MEAFRGWGLAAEIGPERYWAAVERLWKQLSWYSFEELVPARVSVDGRHVRSPGEQIRNRRVVGRYFAERSKLIEILRSFTEELFGGLARASGKVTWCEKTPFNLLSVPFLWELFPEATVIVAVRHPYGVVASHLDQPWAPSSLDKVLSWLEPVYRRWLSEREALLEDTRYLEVRIEDLASDWPTRRKQLFDRLGLADHQTTAAFKPHGVHHRDRTLNPDQVAEIDRRLSWVVEQLAY